MNIVSWEWLPQFRPFATSSDGRVRFDFGDDRLILPAPAADLIRDVEIRRGKPLFIGNEPPSLPR